MLVADSAAKRNAMRTRLGAGTSSVSTFSGLGGNLADSQIRAEIATGFRGPGHDQTAAELPVDPANFTNNLGSGDTDVQAALETIDSLPVSSGGLRRHGRDGDGNDGTDGDDGHTPRVNSGTAFPTTPAPLSPDMFIFNDDVASGLVWLDTDGATALTAASNGDLARYNGTAWVKVINLTGPVSESYERVDSLVFTAVPATTTQMRQQTLAATASS